jgi:hypothetical protein
MVGFSYSGGEVAFECGFCWLELLNGSWGCLLRYERESGRHQSESQNQDMIGRVVTSIWPIRCKSSAAS